MTEVKTEKPKEYVVGETYMINYIGWKKIKLLSINKDKAIVQSDNGEPFKIDINKIKINLL
ncbi:MAG: hypothetical protein IPJ01_11390 [Micavibrio sp.]|nr:hypothetical protein [Micavibrio sp.]